MARHEMLNNVQHQDLKVLTQKSSEFGDDVAGALVFPGEFKEVSKEYPIYFQKNSETGEFQAIALFGFAENENLFLGEQDWQARYIPAIMRREPFLIGRSTDNLKGDPSLVISIDMDSPRISKTDQGKAVFTSSGGNSAYLMDVNEALTTIHNGFTEVSAFFEVLAAYDLIEPFNLEITFEDQSKFNTGMYYTINQEKLEDQAPEVIAQLLKNGYLQLCYLVLFSLSNVRHLIDLKNAKNKVL